MSELISYFAANRGQIIELIGKLVEVETPTGDAVRIGHLVQLLTAELQQLGAEIEIVTTAAGPSLKARILNAKHTKPLLIVGHCDTVWPKGTLAQRPFSLREGRIYGPGVFDMKAGIALILTALNAFKQWGRQPNRTLEIFLSCDEEQGSPSTREIVETMAKDAVAALVLEPCLPGGKVKTARKGIGQFRLTTRGRAAHAGVAPEQGISAITELAHQILKLQAFNDYQRGITVNVGVISGGTISNVVAAEACAEIDVRFWTKADAESILDLLNGLQPVNKGAEIELKGKINRPPLERSEKVIALYEKARQLSQELGFDLMEGQTGGGSDGNFIAALGVPVLDGLGPDGNGAHADYEHVLVDNLAPRAALITRLLETL
jgi:glutamate carboxypeptidase